MYDPGTLITSTTYSWQILAHDDHGHVTPSPIWSFTTGTLDSIPGMVLIPAATYQMGSSDQSWSLPIHAVNVPMFYLDVYEVTNAQYQAFCAATGHAAPPAPGTAEIPNFYTNPAYANSPVVNVAWSDARAYAIWAGKRLPTEAEWELAAKGSTDNRQWPWGNTWVATNANIYDNAADGYTFTSPVGNYPGGISQAGCYDMAGNVWEWCEDDLHVNYNGAPNNGSAWIDSPRATDQMMRGGSYYGFNSSARCTFRSFSDRPLNLNFDIGFRCAKTP
jgi:formylglycine-generating enzyme required for sulfatase activity